jgi:hypothetical protein
MPLLRDGIVASAAQNSAEPLIRFGYQTLEVDARRQVNSVAKLRARNGTLIMLSSNKGFLPFLRNLICSLVRVEVHNWLIIALDNVTCSSLTATPIAPGLAEACVYPYGQATQGTNGSTFVKGIANYGSFAFKRMVMQKPLWVRWLLQQGYTVIQCDLDIVWLQNALPLLHNSLVLPPPKWLSLRAYPTAFAPSGWPTPVRARSPATQVLGDEPPTHPDILFQSEQLNGLNSGFFLARPTNQSIRFFTFWLERLERMILDQPKAFDEQHAFNSALIRLRLNRENLTYGRLEDDQFPNGKIWWHYPMWADKQAALIVHTNWNRNMKKARLMRDGLWFLDRTGRQCAANFDPFRWGCNKQCEPVRKADPEQEPVFWSCESLNRQDDHRAKRFTAKNVTNVVGRFWHPAAYAILPNCSRILGAPHTLRYHEMLFSKHSRARNRITMS